MRAPELYAVPTRNARCLYCRRATARKLAARRERRGARRALEGMDPFEREIMEAERREARWLAAEKAGDAW